MACCFTSTWASQAFSAFLTNFFSFLLDKLAKSVRISLLFTFAFSSSLSSFLWNSANGLNILFFSQQYRLTAGFFLFVYIQLKTLSNFQQAIQQKKYIFLAFALKCHNIDAKKCAFLFFRYTILLDFYFIVRMQIVLKSFIQREKNVQIFTKIICALDRFEQLNFGCSSKVEYE